MGRILFRAAGIPAVAALLVTLLGAAGSSAAAERSIIAPLAAGQGAFPPAATPQDGDVRAADGAIQPAIGQPAIGQPAPGSPAVSPAASSPAAPSSAAPSPAIAAASLEQLVAAQADPGELTHDLKCLAGAIYFEARSESLEGQLAVGRVVVARTRSGRFPGSYCGVVYQRSQFSFIRGQSMPSIDAQSHLWQRAVALARIADAGSWQSPAEGALFFHAAWVPGTGRMTRVAQIDHHIFYR